MLQHFDKDKNETIDQIWELDQAWRDIVKIVQQKMKILFVVILRPYIGMIPFLFLKKNLDGIY